jgi:hypothetical protein
LKSKQIDSSYLIQKVLEKLSAVPKVYSWFSGDEPFEKVMSELADLGKKKSLLLPFPRNL